jgi:carboxyl-terminal processing protease
MIASRPLTLAAAAALVTAGAVAGFLLAPALGVAQSPNARGTTDTYRQLSLFGEVFERVRADYVEATSDEQLVEAAINGMLASLDPHSGFLNQRNFRDMQVQTRGEFGGLGLEVTLENGLVKVISPIDDTPAARAGVRAGDLISHLNGEPVLGLTLNEAVERMRGPVNTDLRITIRREGRDAFDLTLTRARIQVQSVRSEIMNNEIGYVRIASFTEQTTAGLERALARFREAKVRGVVLDLRNNPGGLLDQAVSVSDAFLERGEIVSTRGRRTDEAQRFNAKTGDSTGGLPVVVLINGGSASASEIVAGALQDHRRAIVMGTKSFGKGSVQTIMPLGTAGAMRLTTARYYTPSGRSIQQLGIEPDIEVATAKIEAVDEGQRRREADLRGSLRNDNPGEARPAPVAPARDPAQAPTLGSPDDYQLARAVDLLRGVALFGTQQRAN